MNLDVEFHAITGLMIGVEFVYIDDEDCHSVVLDLLFLRVLIRY